MKHIIKRLNLLLVGSCLVATLQAAPVKLRYDNAPLEDLLRDYSDLTGKTILKASTGLPTLAIDFKAQDGLTEDNYVEAIETLLALHKLSIIPMGEKFAVLVPDAEATKNPPIFIDPTKEKLPEANRYVSVTVKLEHVLPSELEGVLKPFSKLDKDAVLAVDSSRTLVLRDYSSNINRMLEIIKSVDVPEETNEEFAIIPIKYALSTEIATTISSLTNNPMTFTTSQNQRISGSGSRLGGGSSSRPGTSGSTMTPRTTGRPSSSSSRSSSSRSSSSRSSSSSSRSITNPAAAAAARRAASGEITPVLGDTRILAYERNNAVLVIAENAQKMKLVRDLIDELDQVQKQVLIEAIIMDVALDDNLNFGMAIAQDKQKITGDFSSASGFQHGANFFYDKANSITGAAGGSPAGLTSAGLNYWGFLGSSWEVAVKAAQSDTRVDVVSRPRIMTSHAEEATLFIGETHPYPDASLTDVTGGTRETFRERNVGITLNILPFINPDGLVVLDVEQNFEEIIDNKTIGTATVPVTTGRQATAKIAVRDGGVVLLGGFIKTKHTEMNSGVPVLKDIPVIGWMFKENADNNARQELVMLMRPTVLPTPEAAEAEYQSSLNGLPAVRGSTLQERAMQQKLEKKHRQKELLQRQKDLLNLREPRGIDPRTPRTLEELERGGQP